MALSVGIVGLPNVGKSTLFNALLGRQVADVSNYPFCTIKPNIGIVEVPDERLAKLAKILSEKDTKILSDKKKAPNILISQYPSLPKIVPSVVKFVDVAGLVKNANLGEGLGNEFLSHIREVEAVVHVVRAFKDPEITHVSGEINPPEDIEIVNLELELAGIKKPTLYVLNVSEKQLTAGPAGLFPHPTSSHKLRALDGGPPRPSPASFLPICAKLEAELAEFPKDEQKAYLAELGLKTSALDLLISACYKLLGLITFFTIVGGKQVQAWPIKQGKTAFEAAELVHSDFAKAFIKAEMVAFKDLIESGGWTNAAKLGKMRLEGRSYKICDGDVVEFKHGKL